MTDLPRLLAFVAGCAAVFVVAIGVGRLVGPVASEPVADDHGMAGEMGEDHTEGMDGPDGPDDMDMSHHDVGGLEASADGYSLAPARPQLPPGRQQLAFTISGPDGHPVTTYDEKHDRDLHLIVVRRDLTGYQHLHPVLDPVSGEWSTPVDLTPGAWRVLADFAPAGGEPLVLGADVLVPGGFAPETLGDDRLGAQVDGYEVTLNGSLVAGEETVLTATVRRDGMPVTDLQPYLGAYGHLVSLRDGDVGYLHVHPDADGGPGPSIAFHTEFPSPGRYRLFLDFRHRGEVRTAAFTVTAGGGHEH